MIRKDKLECPVCGARFESRHKGVARRSLRRHLYMKHPVAANERGEGPNALRSTDRIR